MKCHDALMNEPCERIEYAVPIPDAKIRNVVNPTQPMEQCPPNRVVRHVRDRGSDDSPDTQLDVNRGLTILFIYID